MGDLSSPEKTEVTFKNIWTEHAPLIKYKRENSPAWVKEERNVICNLQNSLNNNCLKLPLGILSCQISINKQYVFSKLNYGTDTWHLITCVKQDSNQN